MPGHFGDEARRDQRSIRLFLGRPDCVFERVRGFFDLPLHRVRAPEPVGSNPASGRIVTDENEWRVIGRAGDVAGEGGDEPVDLGLFAGDQRPTRRLSKGDCHLRKRAGVSRSGSKLTEMSRTFFGITLLRRANWRPCAGQILSQWVKTRLIATVWPRTRSS